jgi:hypothetical protein
MEEPNSFEKSIFINCPFDDEYKPLLRVIIFTCAYCDFIPKVAETKDSATTRISIIIALLKASQYSIHDLCRMESKKEGELARFNMPFELGIEYGIRQCDSVQAKEKKAIIIDIDPYRYKKAISDISGSDIHSYGDNPTMQPQELNKIIRDWLWTILNPKRPPQYQVIWGQFTEFLADLERSLETELNGEKADINGLPTSEFIELTISWVKVRPFKRF